MRTALPLLLMALAGCPAVEAPGPDAGEDLDAAEYVTVRLAVYDHQYVQLDACRADMAITYGEAYPRYWTRCDGLVAEYDIPVENLPLEAVVLDWLTATIGPPFPLEDSPSPQRWSVQVREGWMLPPYCPEQMEGCDE